MRITLLENEITKNWNTEDTLVSIICTCYNHALYIEQTLESFLTQVTNFPFEIIIHDDASTDNSQELIIEYAKKFPNIVKPILQRDNRYSKGEDILINHIFPNINGQFIAICEGDDYWTDSHKLQNQFELLTSFPECKICFHPALGIRPNGSKKLLSQYGKSVKVFPVEDVIIGGGGYMPTASLMMKREVFTDVREFYKAYKNFSVGDIVIQFIASLDGGVLYIPNIYSVYRIDVNGSWSMRIKKDSNFAIDVINKLLELNHNLDEYSQYRYSQAFKVRLDRIIAGCAYDRRLPKRFRLDLLKKGSNIPFYRTLMNYLLYNSKELVKRIVGISR